MVAEGVELIVAAGSEGILAAMNATTTIPIVMANSGDAVRAGFVASLSRPGGNVTGMTQISPELVGKRLEILREIFPDLQKVGVLWNPNHPNTPLAFQEATEAAAQLGLVLISAQANEPRDIAPALAKAALDGVKAFLVIRDPLILRSRDAIVRAFNELGLAAIFETPDFVEAGGLIAYGADLASLFRQAADYVHRILEGASPAELAVQQPTSFRLVVNQRTARDLGIEIPLALLATADEVVED
jgi:putative ABC transport system substrate-binding protein